MNRFLFLGVVFILSGMQTSKAENAGIAHGTEAKREINTTTPDIDPNFEYYEGGSAASEAELRSKVVDKFRLIQAGIKQQTGKMMRDTHSTGVCFSGKFTFYDRKEPFLKAGGFGSARTIDVPNIRFADANSGVQSNKVPDVRSVSFSLDLDGHRQDFSMNNDPIFTFGSQTDFDNFLGFSITLKQITASAEAEFKSIGNDTIRKAKTGAKIGEEVVKFLRANSRDKKTADAVASILLKPTLDPFEIVKNLGGIEKILTAPNPQNDMVRSVLKTLIIGKLQQNKNVSSYFTENYGSGSAFKFGNNMAMKSILVRCGGKENKDGSSSCSEPAANHSEKIPKDAPDDFLVQRAIDTVNNHSGDSCFELKVQLLDANHMRDQFGRKHTAQEWVEDATLNWNGPAAKKLDPLNLFPDYGGKCYSVGKLETTPNSHKSPEDCDDPKRAFDVNANSHPDLKPLGNINRARAFAEHQSARLRTTNPGADTDSPVTKASHIRPIEQGWDNKTRDAFWYTPQGSYILPYKWFMALKDPESGKPLKDVLEKDGFIPGNKSELNPDGLPIGITKESPPDASFAHLNGHGDWLGITCAACHVGSITVDGTQHIIDGAPAKTDIQSFSLRLEKALSNALKDDASFAEFQKAAGSDVPRSVVKDMHDRLAERNTRSFFHGADRKQGVIDAGPGRTDAFAVILNEVSSRVLGVPENAHEGTAPVSFPKLWGAPYQKWIQYSGLSNNAFTRNTGEVLGVFGDVNLDPKSPHFLQTTARLENIQRLEEHMRSLKPPKWESVFGDFTPEQKQQIERGYKIFHGVANCYKCHFDEKEHQVGKLEPVTLKPAGEFNPDYSRNPMFTGTDPLYFLNLKKNWLAVNPGPLKGTSVIATLLKQDPTLISRLQFADDHVVNGKVERGPNGQKFIQALKDEKAYGNQTNAVQILAQTTLAIGLKYMADNKIKIDENDPAYQKLTGGAVPDTQPQAGLFKTGPLTGIWATGPYLHNGSVRTLRDMLEAPSKREAAFNIGSNEYDQKNGGFVNAGSYPFFANKMGDTNSGHYAFSGAAGLTDSQKDDLVMYLKSL